MRTTQGKPRAIPKQKAIKTHKLKKILWQLCREIIFRKYGKTCYTCGATNLEASNCQLGHFIPSSVGGVGLRFDLLQLRPQCFRCNISLSGNWPVYLEKMTEELGKNSVAELLRRKNDYTKADKGFYEAKIAEYELLREVNNSI